MPREKRDVKELRDRGINSLVLAIELFNRPHDTGRSEAVIMMLHHSFEQLMKAAIKEKTGSIHSSGNKYTYGFDKCLDIACNQLQIITAAEKDILSVLDTHRDTSVHFYQDMSEDLLYVQTQSSVCVFDRLLSRCFPMRLADVIPSRVLPVSTKPPKSLQFLVDSELTQIDELLMEGSRRGLQAMARLRSVMALAKATGEVDGRVDETQLRKAISARKHGKAWEDIFPDIARLSFEVEGEAIPFCFSIKKGAEHSVTIGKPGDAIVGTLFKQEVDWFDKYNLSITDVADKIGLTVPKARAVAFKLDLYSDSDMYGEKRVKSQLYKRYTKRALDKLREQLPSLDIEQVWAEQRLRVLGRQQ